MKKSLKLFMISLMIIPVTTHALTKKETVYSNLDYNGEVKNTIVVNHLYNNETKVLEDETELIDILNLNGKETFKIDNNKLSWSALGNDIFYRGTTKKVLPIDTKITYYLNDKKMEVKDMVGKKGSVKVIINFKNNVPNLVKINNKMETLFTPFVVTAGTMLDSNSKNINVKNGKVVNTGTKSMVVGISSPGLYDSMKIDSLKELDDIVITYDTTKFSLNNIYIVTTPKILEENDLKIFDKLDSLYGNVNTLKSNMDLIEKSVNELTSGVATLGVGSSQLVNSFKDVLNGVQKLENAVESAPETIKKELNDSMTKLNSTIASLKLEDKLSSLNQLKVGNNNTIQTLYKTNETIALAVKESTKNIVDLSLFKTIEEIEQSKVKYKSELQDSYKLIENYIETYESNIKLIGLLNLNNQAIDETLNTLNSIPNLVNILNTEIQNKMSTLTNQFSSLENGIKALNSGVNKIYSEGILKLNDGIKILDEGTKKLNTGVNEFNTKGITTLYNYSLVINKYSSKMEALLNLNKEYKGYTSTNSDSTLFISMVKSAK